MKCECSACLCVNKQCDYVYYTYSTEACVTIVVFSASVSLYEDTNFISRDHVINYIQIQRETQNASLQTAKIKVLFDLKKYDRSILFGIVELLK